MSPLNQAPDSTVETDSVSLNVEGHDSSPMKNDSSLTMPSACSPASSSQVNTCCELCNSTFVNPKVLPCLHTFCHDCLMRKQQNSNSFSCPQCQQEWPLSPQSITDLIPDFAIKNVIGAVDSEPKIYCTICNKKTSPAVGRCTDCCHYLCSTCVMAHQFTRCFGHQISKLPPENIKSDTSEVLLTSSNAITSDGVVPCHRHKKEVLIYFCRTCSIPICIECTLVDHPSSVHDWVHLSEESPKLLKLLNDRVQEYKNKAAYIKNMLKAQENFSLRLKTQYLKAISEIQDTFKFYMTLLEDRQQELSKELENIYTNKKLSFDSFIKRTSEDVDKIFQACDFGESLTKQAGLIQCLMYKKLIDSKFQGLSSFNIEDRIQSFFDFEFVSNFPAIQVGVKNTFGYVRSSSDDHLETGKQPPIARPISNALLHTVAGCINNPNYNGLALCSTSTGLPERDMSNCIVNSHSVFENNISTTYSTSPFGPFPSSIRTVSSVNFTGPSTYEKWPNGSDSVQNYPLSITDHDESPMDMNTNLLPSIVPCKSPVKRQKMIYYCKFGEFGFLEGQFTEPSGVAVNAQNDIIVADTNNHRIQIFDKEGRFKFQFGEVGKRDGQFSYPNRVAVIKTSGDIIVTERSPTHQVQIYNQYGQFVRKFGANILQYPRGVAVDHKGRIIIIECKVMRVVIFDQNGNVLKKFGCSKHVEFPNGVVVNEKEEIFISDNRAHCVKVFNYDGLFLRQIGSYGIINYPIGVGISPSGEILIADNHNNFNLTIFTQEGQLISALESKIKHAQCFDVALMDDGSVVLASKDYRLYIYRYVPIPPLAI